MPHTDSILHGRYAVVSCHVERPLDDEVWRRFSELQRRRPGGFAIAALIRPPANGEDEAVWLERAREAEQLGPFGLHTHWTAPEHARPTGGDPAALVREQGEWLRSAGLDAQLFCGGGWYFDADVARAVADLGYADCTATSFRPGYLEDGAAHLQLDEATWLELDDGRRLLELPTTHSIGMLVRGALGPFRRQVVHAYFHDTDLLDRRRAIGLRAGLAFLGLKRTVTDLRELQRGLRPANTMSFAKSRAGNGTSRPATKWRRGSSKSRSRWRTSAAENICRCVGSLSGGRPNRNDSLLLSRYAFGTDATNVPEGRSTRPTSAISWFGSRKCSSSSPATTTSKLRSGMSSGWSRSAQRVSIPRRAASARAS